MNMDAQPRPRILVVDDEDVTLLMVANIIQSLGADTVLCRSAEEALRYLENPAENFDILMTDIVMPGMGGKELITRVLHDPDRQNIPVIVLSAGTGVHEVADLLDLGDITFLGKPIRMLSVKIAIKNALTNRRLDLLRQKTM